MRLFLRTLATGFAVSIAAGCETAPEASPGGGAGSETIEAQVVTVVTPQRATIRRTTDQPGQLLAIETTPVHARIGGYVKTVGVNIGDGVKKGQVLAELDVPEVEAEYRQKQAMIGQAEADRARAEATVAVARAAVVSARSKAGEVKATTRRTVADVARWVAESARIDQLARESAVTDSLRDETRSKLEAARAAADEAQAQVQSAEAALGESKSLLDKAGADVASAAARVKVAQADASRAEAMLRYARVHAPFDGVVIRRHVDPGHLTVPGGASEPLFVVARTDVITAVAAVPEAEAMLVDAGDPVTVRFPSTSRESLVGKVSRTSWAVDQGTRTLRIEVDLPNPDGTLRPGLYAYTSVVSAQRADVLTLPASAVVRDGGKTFCVTIVGGKASRRTVRLGLGDGTRFEAIEGVSEGEAVVSPGAEGLAEGQPVKAAPAVSPVVTPKR